MNVVAIADRLGIAANELRSIYDESPGIDLELTEAGRALARRFRLYLEEPIGMQLAERGVLSEEEGLWLDGVGG